MQNESNEYFAEYFTFSNLKDYIEASLIMNLDHGITLALSDSLRVTIEAIIDDVPGFVKDNPWDKKTESYFYIVTSAAGLIDLERYIKEQKFTEEELKELNATEEYCVEVLKKHLYLYEQDIHDSLPGEKRASALLQAMTALGYSKDAVVKLYNQLQTHYNTNIVGQKQITSTGHAKKEIERRKEQEPGPSGKGCGSCRVM